MKIACSIIVKDDSEINSLRKCIDSVYPFVSTVSILANGESVDKIKELCSFYPNVHFTYEKWCDDFAKMRNAGFDHLEKLGNFDYYFWLDSDDILVGGKHLQEVASMAKHQGFDVVFLTYWYGCTFSGDPSLETLASVDVKQLRERLIRPRSIFWKSRLHETPVPYDGAKHKYTSYPFDEKERPIAILHTASQDKAKESLERNKRLLEIQLGEERAKGGADPRTLLYLMKIYIDVGTEDEMKKCLEMGNEYLAKSGWDQERGACCIIMGRVFQQLGDDDNALEYYYRSIKEYPHYPEAHLYIAHLYYNKKDYPKAKRWLDMALSIELPEVSTDIVHIVKLKLMSAHLSMMLAYNVDKDIEKALEFAKIIEKEDPSVKNTEMVVFLENLNDLNKACRNTHKVINYLHSIGDDKSVENLLNVLPDAIASQQFAVNARKFIAKPRKWEDNEICYFANFGTKGLEYWDGNSLKNGIGGSETMVIHLSEQLAKMGYKVTVYGDPQKIVTINGVTYMPYYYFNKKDSFNIFIQWRHWFMVDKIKAKKIFIDLHDVFSGFDLTADCFNAVDAFLVKSEAHKKLAKGHQIHKFIVIPNAIN